MTPDTGMLTIFAGTLLDNKQPAEAKKILEYHVANQRELNYWRTDVARIHKALSDVYGAMGQHADELNELKLAVHDASDDQAMLTQFQDALRQLERSNNSKSEIRK